MKYWLVPGWHDRWIREMSKDKKLWGTRKANYKSMEKGDKIIIYASRQKKGFFALVTAISDYRCVDDPTDEYPHEFDFEVDFKLKDPISVKPVLNQLEFMKRVKNIDNWGMSFFNPRELSFKDYSIIVNYMKDNQ